METTLAKIELKDIWNESIIRGDRDLVSRDYLWASQLLKPHVDLWLALKGVQPTNIPNERSRRKFMAGSFFEHFVGMVLARGGVVTQKQDEVWTNFDIRVKGRGDFILTGQFDFDKAQADIKAMFLPLELEEVFIRISERMRERYEGAEFEPSVFEIKSVAERTMTRIEKAGKPLESHIMQTCHYKIGRGLNDGVVAVICRDDLRLFEYHVTDDDEARYVARVNNLARDLNTDVQPPNAPKIIFDEVMGKFSKNLDVEYSSYLTLLYQYDRPDSFSDEMKPIVSRWNRVLPRIRAVQGGAKGKPTKKFPNGKPVELTESNLSAIKEMEKYGFNAYSLAKVADINEEDEEG